MLERILEAARLCKAETNEYIYGGFEHDGAIYIDLRDPKNPEEDDTVCYAKVQDGSIKGYLGFTDVIIASANDSTWETDESSMIVFDTQEF